ncbi:MAG: hypothetical protein NTU97_02155 [Candidatus Magasanikbacteria bacterium]|nr:hypothetical protein [Candidatus Magasanikbacteria bacterium]
MSIIQAQIEPLIHLSNCFFGYFQGVCSYDPNNAPVFFSLGDAVASFGLIFAVFQLSKESWEIVFSIRESWQRRLFWYFGITGLVMVGFSAFIRQFPSGVLEAPYNYPILYELLGFIFFISAQKGREILSSFIK